MMDRLVAAIRRWLRLVPVRLQLTTTECGAACVAMVTSYFGRSTSVTDWRRELPAGRDGLSIQRLAAAAQRAGLTATVHIEPPAKPAGPLILYWAGAHFVVLERVGRRWVRIVDPAGGRRRITRAEYAELRRPGCLELRPGEGFVPRAAGLRDRPVLRYLRDVSLVPGTRWPLAGILAASVGLQSLGLVLPLSTMYAVDSLLPAGRWDVVAVLLWAVVLTGLVHGLATLVCGRLLVRLRARAGTVLTRGFVTHLMRLPVPFFLRRTRGDLAMRLANVAATREALTGQLFTLLLDTALIAGQLAVLGWLSPKYLGLALALGAAQVATLLGPYGRQRRLRQTEFRALADEQAVLGEALEAILPLKANGAEHSAVRRWADVAERQQEAALRRGRAGAAAEAVQAGLRAAAPLALLALGVAAVLRGELTVGAMLAATGIATAALAPLGTMVAAAQAVPAVRAQITRLYDILDEPPEPSGPVRVAGRTPPRIELVDVGFRHEPGAAAVLRDVSFALPAGGTLGIAGRTGSGKTTLALLVLGLLRPTTGRVLFDGVPLEELDLAHVRQACGAVLQQLSLANGSIADNITFGRAEVTQADIEYAARVAGLHEDVQRMPMGYATQVGPGGTTLSAGQRQRVALARALVHRPRLLVLDEATSQLDPATERRVEEAIHQLEVTRLIISHRVSAIANADEILVLDAGHIVERGCHHDLLDRRGHYHDLFGSDLVQPSTVPR